MLASTAAFRAAPNATAAADVVGAMLARWHYIAIGAPLLAFALELRYARRWVLIVLFIGIVLAAAQGFVDVKIRSMRMSAPAPISELRREDPLRRRFGMLHGVSMMLLVLQTAAATAVVLSSHREAIPVDVQVVNRNSEGP